MRLRRAEMKRLILFLLLGCLLFCACAQGEPITSQEFSAVMAEKGFTVEDHTEYLDPPRTENADTEQLLARGKFFVSFDKFADSKEAENVFKAFVNYYSSGEDCEVKYKSGRYLQVQYLDYNGEEKVFIVSRAENTLIDVSANIEFAEEAKQLLEELGYGR